MRWVTPIHRSKHHYDIKQVNFEHGGNLKGDQKMHLKIDGFLAVAALHRRSA